MSPSPSLRLRLRIAALVATSLLAAALAAVLLVEPALLDATHPLPLAFSFVVIAALTLSLAWLLRGEGAD